MVQLEQLALQNTPRLQQLFALPGDSLWCQQPTLTPRSPTTGAVLELEQYFVHEIQRLLHHAKELHKDDSDEVEEPEILLARGSLRRHRLSLMEAQSRLRLAQQQLSTVLNLPGNLLMSVAGSLHQGLARAQETPNVTLRGGVDYDFEHDDTLGRIRLSLPLQVNTLNQGKILEAQASLQDATAEVERLELSLRGRFAEAQERRRSCERIRRGSSYRGTQRL